MLGAAAMLLAACATVPNVPETVTVTVTQMVPVPTWATDPLPVAKRRNETVGEHLRVEDANTGMLDAVANCHRRLLARLNAGEKVDQKDCKK
jgi:hypothetical protein